MQLECREKKTTEDKEGHYILINVSIYHNSLKCTKIQSLEIGEASRI